MDFGEKPRGNQVANRMTCKLIQGALYTDVLRTAGLLQRDKVAYLPCHGGQFTMCSAPDNFQVNLEIAVRHLVTQEVGFSPRHIGVCSSEFGVAAFDIPRGLPMTSKLRITASCVLSSPRNAVSVMLAV